MEKKPTQNELDAFVRNHVIFCQTALVERLIELDEITEEHIMRYYNAECPKCGASDYLKDSGDDVGDVTCQNCGDVFDECEYETTPDVLEWWLVDSWLLARLEDEGETAIHSPLGDWWGRSTSGQAIALDSVIEGIYKRLHATD